MRRYTRRNSLRAFFTGPSVLRDFILRLFRKLPPRLDYELLLRTAFFFLPHSVGRIASGLQSESSIASHRFPRAAPFSTFLHNSPSPRQGGGYSRSLRVRKTGSVGSFTQTQSLLAGSADFVYSNFMMRSRPSYQARAPLRKMTFFRERALKLGALTCLSFLQVAFSNARLPCFFSFSNRLARATPE